MTNLTLPGLSQPMQTLTSQETDEWYTPPHIVEMVRQVLGTIDLDPASHPTPQEWIQANEYYTESDHGLMLPWRRKVFVNPPYNGGTTYAWANKLQLHYHAGDVTEAILLCFAKVGYIWFSTLLKQYPVCLTYECLEFVPSHPAQISANGNGKAKHGSAFFYFGPNYDGFESIFSEIGKCVK